MRPIGALRCRVMFGSLWLHPLPGQGVVEALRSGNWVSLQPLAHETNANRLRITRAFSGGGTRAAVLADGVLEELARTEISLNAQRKRMLAEVDSISAVSGGSFTAAYQALCGDKIPADFEPAILERNVQQDRFLKFATPLGLIRPLSPWYRRGDLAAEYVDDHVFQPGNLCRFDGARAPAASDPQCDRHGVRCAFRVYAGAV